MEKTKNKIKELRISKNLTQQQLADELHVTKQAISKWEKGKSFPDITSVELLSSFFRVSADYLINDSIEAVKAETTGISSKRLNKLSVILTSALALTSATVVALSIALGVILNKKSDTVVVNGFEFTYLSDETLGIENYNSIVTLNFHIYNTTDYTKYCIRKNFSIDNAELFIAYISPNGHGITAHEELKLEIVLMVHDYPNHQLADLSKHSVTVKYAGQAIAKIKW